VFGYSYGIKENDRGNKTLEISVSLEYLSLSEKIELEDIETIFNQYNPIGMLREQIIKIHKKEF